VDAATVESLERATIAAVSPAEVLEIGGWLAPLDDGPIGRAKSAAPLSHHLGPEALAEIEATYQARGLTAAFRVADVPGLAAVRAALAARGYAPRQPTVMKTGGVAGLTALTDAPGEVLAVPTDAWIAVFAGDGFDPSEARRRLAALARAPGALFGAAGEDGRIEAVGVATLGHGWAGVHGMRTAPASRGRGLAARVLAGLGRALAAQGAGRAFLQVEAQNPARRLYRRAGFSPVWTYSYWR